MSVVYRLSIANVSPETLAKLGMEAGLSGTVTSGALGFTPTWGVEPTSVVEMATSDRLAVRTYAERVMRETGESAIYATQDGCAPVLWWADGREEPL